MDAIERAQWDEALARLQSFLAAAEIGGAEHRARVSLKILDRAQQRPGEGAPVERTMKEAFAWLDEWFGQAMAGASADGALALGLAAWRAGNVGSKWPDAVLGDPPPDELRNALTSVALRTSPDLSVSRMVPKEMDFGAMETIAQETWHQFAWAPVLRAALLWTAIFFGSLYAYDRIFPLP